MKAHSGRLRRRHADAESDGAAVAFADGDDGWNALALARANGYTNATSALPRWTSKPLSFTNAGSLECIS